MKEACVFCGSGKFKPLFVSERRRVARCRKCGLVRTLGFKYLGYEKYHRKKEYQEREALFRNIFTKRAGIIGRFFPKPGRVLDVGCATGIFLSILAEKGWEVWGVEPSAECAIEARKKGIKVTGGYFEKSKLPEGFFDLVVFNHTLEHMEDPVRVLRKAGGLLKEKGRVLVDAPNFASLHSKFAGPSWGYLATDEHIHHFEPQSLSKMFKKAGLKPIYVKSHSGIFDLANPFGASGLRYIITAPLAFIEMFFGRGESLKIMGEKVR